MDRTFRRFSCRIALLLLICLCSCTAFAAENDKRSSKPLITSKYASTSINLSTEKLPLRYNGHNLLHIYKDLLKVQTDLRKGEFESTTSYNNRIDKLKSKLRVIGLPASSTLYAFKLDFKYSYDPDTEEFHFIIPARTVWSEYEIDRSRTAFAGVVLDQKTEAYTASNAFGATKTVNRYRQETVDLLPINPEKILSRGQLGFADFAQPLINVKPKLAEELAKDSGAILIASLNSPNLYGGRFYYNPTYDNPVEVMSMANYIDVEIKELWFYRYSTGEVLLKVNGLQ